MKVDNLKIKFSMYIVSAFIAFTIIGTLTHELGHIAVAKYLGYKTYLSYGSMYHINFGYEEDEDVKKFDKLNKAYIEQGIKNLEELDSESLEYFNNLINKIQEKFPEKKNHSLFVKIGGPAQTILTCIIGLFILFFRESKQRTHFQLVDWLGIFLSLFILREVFNTIMALFETAFFDAEYFTGDEFGISRLLGMNQWVLPIITMFIGIAISVSIIFKIIPMRYRFSFIISGLIGGILGYSIWFGFLGALLFPTPISF